MDFGDIEKRPKHGTSKSHFVLLGIVSLIAYNFFLQRLQAFIQLFGKGYTTNSHIVYGFIATVGQILCICTYRIMRPLQLIRFSLVGLAILSFISAGVVSIKLAYIPLHGLLIAGGMGLFISILQSASSAYAADLDSSELLNAFYFGQSLSGLFPWPISSSMYPIFNQISLANRDDLITATCMLIGGLVTLSFGIFMIIHSSPTPISTRVPLTSSPSVWSSFVSEWRIIILCWFTFAVSFSMYPRDLFEWSPLHDINTDFYRSTLVYVAILSDIAGMFAGPYIPLGPKLTHLFGYLRTLFVGVFVLISSGIFPVPEHFHILSIFTMSFSGGLILSSAMSQIQSDNETVGHLVSIALTVGIMTGSCIGSLIDMFL